MKATTNIHKAETINSTALVRRPGPGQLRPGHGNAGRGGGPGTDPPQGKPESELRAAARRHGLNLKELAVKMA